MLLTEYRLSTDLSEGHFPVKRGYGCEDLGIRHSEGFIIARLGFCQSLEGKLLDQQVLKGELQCENKLISYERAFRMLENDIYISLELVKRFSSY